MSRRKEKQAYVKGREIRFVRGTYKGCKGWIDKANKTKKGWVWTIVNDEDYEEERHARVQKSSVREKHEPPTNWAQAAIQTHPEIDFAIIELSRMFATCNTLTDASWGAVTRHLVDEIKLAQVHLRAEKKQVTRMVTFNGA